MATGKQGRTLVVSSAPLPLDVAAELGDELDYLGPAEPLDRPSLLARAREAVALITLLTDRVDAELMDSCPHLRIIANCAVGYDNVDVAEATRRNIIVTNTPGVLTDATADFAFALLLAAARRVIEGDALARSGTWTGWKPTELLGLPVAGRTLGIVGLGRIGQAVARRARGFDMRIIYSGPRQVAGAAALPATRVGLDELLATADFVSLHCPSTPETHHLIDAAALARMKPTAVLVNTARGAIVDEVALADALARGQIAAAGLDVFEAEPVIHPGLRGSDRVVLAPHAGSATTTTRGLMAKMCTDAIKAALAGECPANALNPEVCR